MHGPIDSSGAAAVVLGTPQRYEGVAELLFRAGTSYDGYTSQMRRAFALNAHERLAVAALWERGPMTMTELGAWIPLSRAAVTTLVDRLEEAQLVTRASDPTDRRRTVVQITQAVSDRMAPVVAPWVDEANALVSKRTPQDWETIRAFLEDYRTLNQRHAELLGAMSDDEIQELAAAGI